MGDRAVRFGHWRASAYVSFFLGALSLLGVLCFRFPEYLTTPELRAAYDVDFLRTLLLVAITVSLTLRIVPFRPLPDTHAPAAHPGTAPGHRLRIPIRHQQ